MSKSTKVAYIVGARPQFVKLAALWPHRDSSHQSTIIHTGQHYDANLSENFFLEFDIPQPEINLEIGSGSHAEQIGLTAIAIEKQFQQDRPDLVVVFGDTNSTLACSLVAHRLDIPVAHVEAGLRSYNRIPEECNRVLTDRLSTLLFSPCQRGVDNLRKEGIIEGVHMVGDVMFDIALRFADRLEGVSIPIQNERFAFLTVHRAHNTDDPARLGAIFESLLEWGEKVLFPCHPRTRKMLSSHPIFKRVQNSSIQICDPLGYRQILRCLKNAHCALTDSGGLQKEAYFMQTPCLTLRETTEWPETIETGYNRLVGCDKTKILNGLREMNTPAEHPQIYGDGRASSRMMEILSDFLTRQGL